MKRGSVFLLILLAVSISAAWAQTTIPIDPKATYLRTNEDPQALNASPISLDELGIRPGDTITVSILGDISYCVDCDESPVWLAGGVFSSSKVLLPPSELNRVPAARPIRQGTSPPCESWITFWGNLPTDIPEDFGFWSYQSATVKVPPGAHWLFIAVVDSFYGDNSDLGGDLAVQIQKATVTIPLSILWRVVPWETNRMTTSGAGERDAFPNEGEIFYAAADWEERGTTPLYRYSNGSDHRDSALTDVGGGYWGEGPLAFSWTSNSLPGLSPMVEGFNPQTGDYALMQPGEKLTGYSTEGLNVFGYKRFYNQTESLLTLSGGGVTVQSDRVHGGRVWQWTWNGTQFLNHSLAYRGSQALLFFDAGEGWRGMIEGADDFQHGCPLVRAQNEGLTHKTRTVPLENDPTLHGGGPDNPLLWRDVILGKDLLLNFNSLGSVVKYTTVFSLPSRIDPAFLYEPIITLRPEFNRFWVYYADSDKLQEVTDGMPAPCNDQGGQGSHVISPDFGGVIVSDSSSDYAFGVYGVNVSKGGSITDLAVLKQYCWADGGTSDNPLDHSRIDVMRFNAPLPSGESRYNVYVVTDTVQGVKSKMHELFLSGAK